MAIKMVRQPSETPNINNVDDIVGLRYSYGNQNGYVIGKGNEVSHSVNGSTFTINSGRLVLQGVEVDIDANGLDLIVDNIATKQYYSVYLTVNLALNTVQIQFTVDTTGYPEINPGDDLTKNTSGIARLELYRFTAQNGVISEVAKVVQAIKYIEDRKVADALRINGIEIKQDKNGVLKVGDIIIPQKKLLWSGTKEFGSGTTTLFTLSDITSINSFANKTYEVVFSYVPPNVSMRIDNTYLKIRVTNVDTATYNQYSFVTRILTADHNMMLRFYSDKIEGSYENGAVLSAIYEIIE